MANLRPFRAVLHILIEKTLTAPRYRLHRARDAGAFAASVPRFVPLLGLGRGLRPAPLAAVPALTRSLVLLQSGVHHLHSAALAHAAHLVAVPGGWWWRGVGGTSNVDCDAGLDD